MNAKKPAKFIQRFFGKEVFNVLLIAQPDTPRPNAPLDITNDFIKKTKYQAQQYQVLHCFWAVRVVNQQGEATLG